MKYFILAAFVVMYIWLETASAEDKPTAPPAADAASGEQVDVEGIKKKYWASGDESQLGVVQNRQYSKARKFDLGVLGGLSFSDPFLVVKEYGGSFGYHFNEFFGVHLVGFKYAVSDSSAKQTLEQGTKRANTNPQQSYVGAEGSASLLYGKLSLVGKSIIYYDMHFSAGGGMMSTETGKSAAGSAGLGQRFFISKITSLRVDYRMVAYKETIVEKEIVTKIGQPVGSRMNYSHSIFFGIDFLIGKGAEQ